MFAREVAGSKHLFETLGFIMLQYQANEKEMENAKMRACLDRTFITPFSFLPVVRPDVTMSRTTA